MALPNELHPLQLGAGSVSSYQIEQSLRFDGGSYLSRTPGSAGNRRTSTLSFWFKWESRGGEGVFLWANGRTKLAIDPGGNDALSLDDYDGSFNIRKLTTQSLRDPSAWYHAVVVMDTTNATAGDRHRLYLNGQRITAFSTSTDSGQNFDTDWNNNVEHRIGADNNPFYFRGYIAEMHMLDGTAVTDAEDFGEYDNSGVWRPIEVTGLTYGTNGFYLKFDPTAANGIGHDHSGNGNNWTPSGFVTTGTGTDVMSDTPTKNWCTLNPLHWRNGAGNATFSEGNLKAYYASQANESFQLGTIGASSGKFYWEFELTAWTGDRDSGPYMAKRDFLDDSSMSHVYYYRTSGAKVIKGTTSNYGDSFGVGDIIGTAVDLDGGNLEFFKNGVSQGIAATDLNSFFSVSDPAFPGSRANFGTTYVVNFGQREFAHPPGTASATDYFNTITYTGDGGIQSVTGCGFQPDFVWIKNRDITDHHALFDVVRGVEDYISSNRANAEALASNSLTAFDSDGFTVSTSGLTNYNGQDYVAWCWKAGDTPSSNTDGTITSSVSANQDAGFSVVTYTGTGANATVGHGLGAAADFILIKSRSNASSWQAGHSGAGWTKYGHLDLTNSFATASSVWQDTAPTSTVFSLGTETGVNGLDRTYVAYCFAEKAGVSKFGSYVGNGSADGPYIETGFKPAMVIRKAVTDTSNWNIQDTARGKTSLHPNLSNPEGTGSEVNMMVNGFKVAASAMNGNGTTYIYAAFAENFTADDSYKSLNTANLPAPTVKDGSKNFNPVIYAPDGSSSFAVTGVGFQPDLVWVKSRVYNEDHQLNDAVRGATKGLQSNLSNGEVMQTNGLTSFDSNGFTVGNLSDYNYNGDSIISWNWKANGSGSSNTDGSITSTVSANTTAGFSIVSYTGTGVNATVGHGLGVAPDFIINKIRNVGTSWAVWHKDLGTPTTGLLELNSTGSELNSATYWNSTTPSSTTVSLGTYGGVNTSSEEHIMYCFAEVEGYSKIGSYTGNGSTDGSFVYCGFRPAWIMVKSSSNPYGWAMFDTARKTYNEIEILLEANNSTAESSNSSWGIDILSNGFKWRNGGEVFNYSGYTYIFAAFAEHPFGGDGVSPATAR